MKSTKLFALLLLPALATGISVFGVASATNNATFTDVFGEPANCSFNDNEDLLLTVDGSGNPKLLDLSSAVAMVIDGDNVSYFDTISAATAAWGDGTTLKLNKDVEGQILVNAGEKTFDLNNHVLNYSGNPTIGVDGAKLHIVDNSENKTTHYYVPSEDGVATLSATETSRSFQGGYITGGSGGHALELSNGAEATFSSGTIFGKEGGGAVGASVPQGTKLTMEGTAAIIGNYQNADKYPYTSGAAMVVNGAFVMNGGKIVDNTASTGVGGVRVGETAAFTMTGGEISGNMGHSWLAGGIHVDNNKDTGAMPTVSLGGSAKVYNNRYMKTQKNLGIPSVLKLNIVEPFTKEANIHIFAGINLEDNVQGKATAANPIVLTSNWSSAMGKADPYPYFSCDPIYNRAANSLLATYEVYSHDGQAVAAPVSYAVSFDGNGGTGSMPAVTTNTREYAFPENGFTAPEGMKFLGWKTSEDGEIYLPGEKVLLTGDATIIAAWIALPDPEWNGLSGTIYAPDGTTPIVGAKVKLIQGNDLYDIVATDAQGVYRFSCPNGFYNLVVEYGDSSKTVLVESVEGAVKNITLSNGTTDSILDVVGDFGVAVGGLDAEAEAIRAAEGIPENKDVRVTMNVEKKTEDAAAHAEDIMEEAPEQNFEFIEAKVAKTIDGVTTELESTSGVIEIVVPYEGAATRREITVYSYHSNAVKTFVESDTKAAGTFAVDKANGLVKIYTDEFSTFAIGYTPCFKLGTTISLGSYTGTVTATLKNVATGDVTTLTDVALDEVTFIELKRGNYILTITWVDGATNSISMPVTIE